MAETALITITNVRDFRLVDSKFDSTKFAAFVQEVQRKNLRGLLGDALYYAFMNDADNALKEWNRALELDPELEAALKNKKLLEDAMRGSGDGQDPAS